MKRFPWDIMLALLVGIGLGLAYSWILSPPRVTDSVPAALRADFKDYYRSAIAAAYAASGNLPRAQARLSLLGDPDPAEALNAQAQRMLASGLPFEQADQVVGLAAALEQGIALELTPTSSAEVTNAAVSTSVSTLLPESSDASSASETPEPDTPQPVETQPVLSASTPRPTPTQVPTLSAPFTLTGQETVCDPNLPDGLLQVIVFDSRRRQLAGAKIVITWEGGEEAFFTGLKPELGNGYADFIMEPETSYTVQLGVGSDIASGLTASTCQSSDGDTFLGGVKLTFKQP